MRYLVLLGRILFSTIFAASSINHFSRKAIDQARSQGVPLAKVAVPVSGVLALLGSLSVALGYKARWGAWLLTAFLLPVTLMMHSFWKERSPEKARTQQAMFLKNLSMLGGALLIAREGAGQLSVDSALRNRRHKLGVW